jgi:hypothetical protein
MSFVENGSLYFMWKHDRVRQLCPSMSPSPLARCTSFHEIPTHRIESKHLSASQVVTYENLLADQFAYVRFVRACLPVHSHVPRLFTRFPDTALKANTSPHHRSSHMKIYSQINSRTSALSKHVSQSTHTFHVFSRDSQTQH